MIHADDVGVFVYDGDDSDVHDDDDDVHVIVISLWLVMMVLSGVATVVEENAEKSSCK